MTEPWRASVLTIFPDLFPGPLGASLIGRALENQIWSLEVSDIRDFATDKHRSVDDTPAGGGPGMVMRADILAAAIDSSTQTGPRRPVIYLSPRGTPLTQKRVRSLSEGPGAILLCGRFEGVDERVLETRGVEEISLGDYVLSGGEVAAMVLLEAVVRLLPQVMGAAESGIEESFENDLLEYPQYTRPQTFEGKDIPEILTSGDHGKIAEWRQKKSEELTRHRRPDLWSKFKNTDKPD
ncbi:MAG: tRNA (guanosine(37)-N1)-methyltransferase TrmD [Fimbriimonadaceae bacterium]|nr:tRNA (guanosine(37)-N1)-methyltransferase TrmD [Alphaproteobacteria bacterium]